MRNYKVKPVVALSRGLDVIRALQSLHAASLHDLHRSTGLPKSTLTRIVHTLHRHGMVWQRMADGAFLPSRSLEPRVRLDPADWLVELASPVLESLGQKVSWPSALTVPREDYMEVIESNQSRSYFDDIALGALGARTDMLRSASGRAYLAFCPDEEREAVLERLRERNEPGDARAHDAPWLHGVLESTRACGYSVRDADFRGLEDELNAIAMPIRLGARVLGCINLTWKRKLMTVHAAVERHLEALTDAVNIVESRVLAAGLGADGYPSADAYFRRS
jgi:IclR family mhp operon transcriptional activator